MVDLIGSAPDMETLQAAAQATGFLVDGEILTHGVWSGREGNWFLNIIEDGLVDAAGVWVRLRWNDADFDSRMTQFIAAVRSAGLTVYENDPTIGWTSDGETPAAAWVGDVGVIL
jgi:squalene cyclase